MVLNNSHVVEYLQGAKGWNDYSLEADHWAALTDIAPIDAAMLLCQFNPNAETYDSAMLTTTDELTPEHLRRLAQRLADTDKADHKPRTLRDWHQTARRMGLTYHSWIDGYMEESATPTPPVADTAPPEPQVAPVVAVAKLRGEPSGNEWVLKKSALIKKYRNRWVTIERDLQDASDNGLSGAAKAPEHGNWRESAALQWAEQRGKLTMAGDQTAPLSATPFTGLTHRMKG